MNKQNKRKKLLNQIDEVLSLIDSKSDLYKAILEHGMNMANNKDRPIEYIKLARNISDSFLSAKYDIDQTKALTALISQLQNQDKFTMSGGVGFGGLA
ncbi:MAG: hypothetical protein LBT37_05215 [Lactobacillaceae bacterium]|nr:hypothetical protein [Lactobacillaceae bacterium]